MTLLALALPISWFCVSVDPRFIKGIHQAANRAQEAQVPFVVPMPHDLSLVRDRRRRS